MGPGRTLGDVIALGLLMTICCPYRGHSQELQIVEKKWTINGLLGQDVTIPCSLTDKDNREPDLDLPAVNVRWCKFLRDGKEMDVYKFDGSSHEAIRSGSAIEERELKRGNASLSLPRVQRSDEGEYICTIFITPQKYEATINVQILAQPDVTLSATKLSVEPGSEKSVTCEVSKFYPEEVKISWEKFSKRSGDRSVLDTEMYQSGPKENSDGSSNVTSLLIVAPSSPEENGDVYSCVVIHASFSQEKNVSLTLTVIEPFSTLISEVLKHFLIGLIVILLVSVVALRFLKVSPEVSDIVGADDLVHMKRSALTFMASGYKPKNIEIHLYLKRKGSEEEHKINSWNFPAAPQRAKQYKGDHLREEGLQLIGLRKDFSLENAIHLLQRLFMSSSCLCSTHITPDIERDEGAELIIKVIHRALKSPLLVRKMLQISEAEPVGKPITFHHEEHQAGQ